MVWLERPHELRRTRRVRSRGSVDLHCGDEVLRGRVHDVAAGGINIQADVPLGTAHLRGGCVRIDLRFDRGSARRFVLDGRVLRVAIATRNIVVAFDAVPCDYEEYIQDELLDTVQRDRLPHMILVDTDPSRRGTIAGTFRIAGCQVSEVGTPLDAIARLDQFEHEPELIAISDEFPEAVAENLRDYISATRRPT